MQISINLITRLALAFGAGCALSLVMPPVGLFPLLFICIPLLALLNTSATTGWQSFLTGWIFGFGYFCLTLHWLGTAFKTFFGTYALMQPFITIIIPAYIATYYGLVCVLSWPLRQFKTPYLLSFACLMFFAEYLRGDYLTHFPWSTLGYAWHHVLPVLQITSVIGIVGLTFLSILWVIAVLMPPSQRMFLFVTFFLVFGWGWQRLQTESTSLDTTLRLVQPNIAQDIKEDPAQEENSFQTLLSLSTKERFMGEKIDAIIWPETVLDIFTFEQKQRLSFIAQALPAESRYTILGINRRDQGGLLRNSVIALDPQNENVATHDKFILAPWGEAVPYPDILKHTPLSDLVNSGGMMSPGQGAQTIRLNGFPSFSPIICFESTFSGRMINDADRPDFLLFITNDAWSDGTWGPAQHFGFARVRAIEEGLGIMRSANTGLTAVIDPYGRIEKYLPEQTAGIIDSAIPAPLPETLFSQYKNTPAIVWGVILLLLSVTQIFITRKKQ